MPTLEKGTLRRLCLFLPVSAGPVDQAVSSALLEPFARWPGRFLGLLQLDVHDVRGSLAVLDRWLRDGPMVGVYFAGSGAGALPCTHPNYDPLVRRIAEISGLIVQHNWFKTGGKDDPGGSTPAELAVLAARYPEQAFLSAHAGGEWEQGIRAVRGVPNILVETSGFDPTAGFIEMAVRELGSRRIVFGSHLPSRSLGTELGKVVAAQVTEEDKRRILGENLRRLLEPILKRKGMS